jgi:hypothetical protein
MADVDEQSGSKRKRVDRRRLDDVFGDVLPDTTDDERDPRDRAERRGDDDWYLANRPPHHDRD